MAIPKKILNFLKKSKLDFAILEHKTVYTAFDKSQTLKVNPEIVGKTLILKKDGKLAIVLIPANKNLSFKNFKRLTKAKKVEFISEKLMAKKFRGVKVGAVPPFGNLWKIETFADKSLFKKREIILNGGNYNFSIKIKSKDFKKLVPDLILGNFGKKK